MILVSHCFSPLVIGNKLYYSLYAESVLPITVTCVQSLCPYHEPFFIVLSPLIPLRSGSGEREVWCSAASQYETTQIP